ncbi:MAG: TetR/AcrR family transcriptional regulator [Candidatus Dormibacteraeota bacterium]|uniref:TetR/AcrR family transcriptional regulator n=1 Tax=Candidatus Aeolococcus gillhamiae TaxID=3127015 RepID=A0A934N2A5_9BACT|nr:TetR/AcrR family transcriptional regulator [Candidatus Dormibacteraeota bacterium]
MAAHAILASASPPAVRARRHRPNEAGDRMRTRIVDAALQALRRDGYAGVSVRAIAATGAFSPALVFYHFGSVDALLLAVLDQISGEQLARYQARLGDVSSLAALAAAMEELYGEDLELGQLTAVQEIVGAMAFDPALGPEIVSRMQPWMTFAEALAQRIVAGSPLAGRLDPGVIGSAVIALYMGLEIVARMRGGDTSGSKALVATLTETAPWIDGLLGKGVAASRRRSTKRLVLE